MGVAVEQVRQLKWRRLVLTLLVVAVVSLGLAYLGERLLARIAFPRYETGLFAYLTVFAIALVINVSFVPLPFAVSIMIALAARADPVLVALFGSLGASIGELSSYYAGFVGKRLAIPDDVPGYQLVRNWIRRYGIWAVAVLSFQPVLPFEIAGLLAGAAKMPLYLFFPGVLLGKFPKYVILIYVGTDLVRLLPFPH